MAKGWLPIEELAAKVRAGELKASELVEKSLLAAEEAQEYNALLAVLDDGARSRARHIDQLVAEGKGQDAGRLAGVPFVAKDNFLTFGSESTAASAILKGFAAPYQATAVEKLEAEGAICVAKANMDAFGHGSSTEHSDVMVTKNPVNPEYVPGGSSGGSAAAVKLGIAPFSIATDTGGSIRQPASYSGVVGYKPTYGLVSRSGVVAMASSTDTIGPLALTVEDAAVVIDVMAGTDPLDGTTTARNPDGYTGLSSEVGGKKIGVIKEYMGEGLSADVREPVEAAIEKLKVAGAEVTEISLPSLPAALAAYYIIVPAEISSNLARYDGQRFGYRYSDAATLDESYSKSRSMGFGKEAKRRIMIGTYVLSSGYYDAYYKKAQIVRTKLIREFAAAFETVDFLVGPVAPTTAFKIGENNEDPLQMYLIDIMTVAVNLAGIPAISLPAGLASNGLPVGLQIMAAQHADRALLAFAKETEGLLL